MQTRHIRKGLPFILCIVLIVAAALFTTDWNGSKESEPISFVVNKL